MLGQRPSLVESASVADPAIAAVIDRLEMAESATFTATYTITSKFGGNTAEATVTADGGRRSITVGDVRFLLEGAASYTCDLENAGCIAQIEDARVSDLQITHRFWGRSTAQRLRTDANRALANGDGATIDIAEWTATCVEVTVPGGVKTYCALDSGVLARYDGADVNIELTSYSPEADEALFSQER